VGQRRALPKSKSGRLFSNLILEEIALSQRQFQEQVAQMAQSHLDLAARQQYHDEAFERHDAEMKVIREAIAADAEDIRALARLERLEGEEPA
jgi:hypothetical protein